MASHFNHAAIPTASFVTPSRPQGVRLLSPVVHSGQDPTVTHVLTRLYPERRTKAPKAITLRKFSWDQP